MNKLICVRFFTDFKRMEVKCNYISEKHKVPRRKISSKLHRVYAYAFERGREKNFFFFKLFD